VTPSETLEKKLEGVPDLPGAYMMRDANGDIIYVGKARSLRKRLRQHFRKNPTHYGWTQQLYAATEDLDYVVTGSELEAFILEANLIKEHKPKYNIRLSDDKSYPYLKLTDEMYPRLMVLRDLPKDARVALAGGRNARRFHDPRRHEVHRGGSGRIFGPYPGSGSMRSVLQIIPKLFKLRSCRRKLDGTPNGVPCLNLHIGRCVGPCRGSQVVPAEEYQDIVRQTARFLDGKSGEIMADLQTRMEAAAGELDFERAAVLRDRLKAVGRVAEDQVVVANDNRDQDVVGVAVGPQQALVALLRVRGGRLLKQEQYVFGHVSERSAGEVIDAFLTQHYSRATDIPPEVLLCEDVREASVWGELLGEARGAKVTVFRPQRGEKRRLAELAAKNAQVGLAALENSHSARQQATQAALSDLADALALESPPRRIECFDISTTHGHNSTGSQVVFTDGLPDKRNYRRYRMIATEGKPDDYAMMAEMLVRRLRRGLAEDPKFTPLPDLILVDGGKGQLSTAVEVLEGAGLDNLPIAGLAKQEEQVFVPGESDPLDMSGHQTAHLLLRRVRDEAHRFAITHHRGLRDSQITKSVLDDIPGIGPVRRTALLKQFPSVQDIARASVDELAAVRGMTRKAAEELLQALTAAPKTTGDDVSPPS